MKRFMICMVLALAMVVAFAGFAAAAGTYDVDLNGSQVSLVFNPGPFGPGEAGLVNGYVEDELVLIMTYIRYENFPIYMVDGLGTFFVYAQYMVYYQDLLGKPLVLRPEDDRPPLKQTGYTW